MLKLSLNSLTSLAETAVDSEYFASRMGFAYPEGQYDATNREATFRLMMDPSPAEGRKRNIGGILVWHNQKYEPLIQVKECGEVVTFDIANRSQLPYPIIQAAEAWLRALVHYLVHKRTEGDEDAAEMIAKQIYLSGLDG